MYKLRVLKETGAYGSAVALEYAYASMLMHEADIDDVPGVDRMRELNEEARFSRHELTAEHVHEAEAFTDAVIGACRRKWSRREQLRSHWIRWII